VADLGLYLRLFASQTRAQAQYRTSLWLDVVGSVLMGVLDLSAVVVLFRAGGVVAGFATAEALLIAAIATIGFAVADLLVGNMDTVRNLVRTGRMDAVLLRPLGAFGQLVAMDFQPRRAGRLVVAVTLLPIAASWAGVDWTGTRVAAVLLAVVGGSLLFGAIFTFTDMAVVDVLTNGGPNNATQVLTSWAFFRGIDGGDVGQGAAIALFLFPILLAAAIAILRAVRRMEIR